MKNDQYLLNSKISQLLFDHPNETELLTLSQDGRKLTGKIFKLENLKFFSTKFYTALTNINKLVNNPQSNSTPKTAFIYSNLVKVGIELFQEILLQNGYLEYQENTQSYQLNEDTVCYFCGHQYGSSQRIPTHFIQQHF